MNENEASRTESLEEGTREANSNLKRLLEAIGGVLTGSAELLVRLQHILSGTRSEAGTNGSKTPETPGGCDC